MSLDSEINGGICDEAKVAVRGQKDVRAFGCGGYFAPLWVLGQEVESLGRFEVIGDTEEGVVGVKMVIRLIRRR